jgi:hypothetical protein
LITLTTVGVPFGWYPASLELSESAKLKPWDSCESRFDVLLLHLLKARFEAVGFGPLARPVLLDFLPLEVFVLFGHDQVFAHADGEALVQAALLAEAPRDRRDLALVVEGALELLLDEGRSVGRRPCSSRT